MRGRGGTQPKGVAAARRIDDLHLERRHPSRILGVDRQYALGAARGRDAADAAVEEHRAPRLELDLAGQRDGLLVVREQVVEVLERRGDPVQQPVARREQVGGRHHPGPAGPREDPRRRLAAHELGAAEVQVRGRAERLGPRLIVANQAFISGDRSHMAILDVWVGEDGTREFIPASAGRRP
jgi:hypothetical protein